MHEDENGFHKLWMTTAENLSIEIPYQKLKLYFNYCFRHEIFQNQLYKFLVLFPVSFRSAVLLSEFLVIQMFVKIRCVLYRF